MYFRHFSRKAAIEILLISRPLPIIKSPRKTSKKTIKKNKFVGDFTLENNKSKIRKKHP
jgi:hypothetical protein